MNSVRSGHTATLLPNGTVLLAGGYDGTARVASAEIYDPETNSFALLSQAMAWARDMHTATLLPNGKVLITAGYSNFGSSPPAELFDPELGTFTAIDAYNVLTTPQRYLHSATLLPSGAVLIAGGSNGQFISSCEIFD